MWHARHVTGPSARHRLVHGGLAASPPAQGHGDCGQAAEDDHQESSMMEPLLTTPSHEAIDHRDPVHEWRVWQLTRLQHGCPPRLALDIVR